MSSVVQEQYKDAEELFSKGKYTEALSIISNVGTIIDTDTEDILLWEILESKILFKLGRFEETIEKSKKTLELSEKKRQYLQMIDSLICIGNALTKLGNLDWLQSNIVKAEELLEKTKTDQEQELIKRKISLCLLKGTLLRLRGNNEKSLELYQQCLFYTDQINDKPLLAECFSNLGNVYFKIGDTAKALEFFQKWLAVNEDLDNKYEIAKAYNNIGLVYIFQGNSVKALEYLTQSLSLKQSFGIKRDMVNILCNIGGVYHERGELDKALAYYEQCYDIRKEIGNKQSIATGLCNIGSLYHELGELDKAVKFCQKSYEVIKESGDAVAISRSLYVIITILIDKGNFDDAFHYLQEFENIAEKGGSKRVLQLFDVAKAKYLMKSTRLKDKFSAQIILEKVIEEPVIRHSVTVSAMIDLCELLLFELKSTGEEKVLNEVAILSDKLLKIAKNQNSHSLLAETYLLKYKIALIDFDIDEARTLLLQAQFIAEEMELKNLSLKISNEHDVFLSQITKWEEYQASEASLLDRLELSDLDDYIKKMGRKGDLSNLELEEEIPVLLMILAENGLNLFNKKFLPETMFDESLIAGFLTAVNVFLQETFKAEGSLERIKHQDYTILIKAENNLLYCYVFKGKSFGAQHKIRAFVDEVNKLNTIRDALINMGREGRLLDQYDFSLIENIVKKIFANGYKNKQVRYQEY
jgi:tetratricopeptide (TPR) repeat protein